MLALHTVRDMTRVSSDGVEVAAHFPWASRNVGRILEVELLGYDAGPGRYLELLLMLLVLSLMMQKRLI